MAKKITDYFIFLNKTNNNFVATKFASNISHGTNNSRGITGGELPTHPKQTDTSGYPAADNVTTKPFTDIPGPKGLPFIGTIFERIIRNKKIKEMGYLLAEQERKDVYGHIYKECLLNHLFVFITHPRYVEIAYRYGEKNVETDFLLRTWRYFRQTKGYKQGLITSSGKEWKRNRTVFDKILMVPKEVNHLSGIINCTVKDFIEAIESNRDEHFQVHNWAKLLQLWTVEAMGAILFEHRFGCFSKSVSDEVSHFIQAIHDLTKIPLRVYLVPPRLAQYLLIKDWRRMCNAWEKLYEVGRIYVREKMEEINNSASKGEVVGGLMAQVLRSDLEPDEVEKDLIDLMGGGVDTTANILQWTLYKLGCHTEIQERAYQEVIKIVPGEETPSSENIKEMHYLKGVIKEVLRLYPIGPFTARKMNQDVVIGGYHIPAQTDIRIVNFVMFRDPEFYEDPNSFKPERWILPREEIKVPYYARLPFGFGPRMCIGRRIAEMSMALLTAQMLQRFRIVCASDEEIEADVNAISAPKKQAPLLFYDRYPMK